MPRPLAAFLLSSTSSDSVLSHGHEGSYTESLEVTEEQHLLNLSVTSSSEDSKQRRGRLNLRRRRRKPFVRQPLDDDSQGIDVRSMGDLSRAIDGINRQYPVAAVERDAATVQSVGGLRSVSTFQTFSSHDTVKASNKASLAAAPAANGETKNNNDSKPKTRWKNIKKAIAVVTSASFPDGLTRQRSKDNEQPPTPLQSRSRSAGSTEASTVNSEAAAPESSTKPQLMRSDALKRGRLDGMDVLSLGSAFVRIFPLPASTTKATDPWDDWTGSCIGKLQDYAPAVAVRNMLRTAAGQSPPNIVFEGFCEADRWSLRIEQGLSQDDTLTDRFPSDKSVVIPPPPVLAASSSEDDGAPDIPADKLWTTLWGSEPAPASTLPTLEEIGDEGDGDDPLLDLAAESSVPIDVDEDTFIVSTPDHLNAIHSIASVPVAAGRFGPSIRILKKLLLGLDTAAVCEETVKENLRGVACHNIGLLHLWEENYSGASEYLAQASEARKNCRMVCGRDFAVTLVRHGQAVFAMRRYAEALKCFEEALALTQEDQVIRAKVLNNAGVAHYVLRDFPQALEAFTQALTIQRKLLDEPIRRESLVYDASVTLSNMGKLYLERGDPNMASFVYEEALVLQKTVFRKEHPLVIESVRNLAFSRAHEAQGMKAVKLLEKCRRIQVNYYGSNSATPVMETCGWLAHLCARENQQVQAQALYEAVYAWQKAFLPKEHPERQHVKACLNQLKKKNRSNTTSWL